MANPREPPLSPLETRYLPGEGLAQLFVVLHQAGYTIIGPTRDQAAIILAELNSPADLPRGWADEQGPAKYRLTATAGDRWFGYVVGPMSWKQFLFPADVPLMTADRGADGWTMRAAEETPPRLALFGARACDLAALAIQDQVFLHGPFVDPVYAGRRRAACIIAVNCSRAAGTCFCASLGTGPRCTAGFDLALTEVTEGLLVEIGSELGQQLMSKLPNRAATADEVRQIAEIARRTTAQLTRHFDTAGLRDHLFGQLEHPHWDTVAARCLSCGNCTSVCPTCFCSSVTDISDIHGDHIERRRRWDSCFQVEFSHIHGGPVRSQIRARYRQWLTHKLAGWQDQFGVCGCVGCGRCISWCPAGIDLTAEVACLQEPPE